MDNTLDIITYRQLLEELESKQNHLLLGNGFNNSLGIKTDYKSIFTKMIEAEPVYRKIEKEVESDFYNIEKLIGRLQECLKEEVNSDATNAFLNSFIQRKVKSDFMIAASQIVCSEVKGIYQEKNQGIYLLFRHFSTYFTLNYDSFLYLLLMKFKKSAIAFQNDSLFINEKYNKDYDNIYNVLKAARNSGKMKMDINNETTEIKLKHSTKDEFFTDVWQVCKKTRKPWSKSNVQNVCDKIWDEEQKNQKISDLNDGFKKRYTLFVFDENCINQNVFFIHGCFHIYEDNTTIYKITQKQNKALYKRLHDIIGSDNKEIVCVLANNSNSKQEMISNNDYLEKCFNSLSNLTGSLVIFGSALSENDRHIIEAINKSNISKIYISSSQKEKLAKIALVRKYFVNKQVSLFDYDTVSYDPITTDD